jgi:macrodomain Ter protein organizer (MatP/YcbG family)
MDRQDTILELMRTYLDMSDDNLNKKEIKGFLKDELKNQLSLKQEPTVHLLKGWIDNALRTDLENKLRKEFGIKDKPLNEEHITTIPIVKPKN